ncbi:MAG: hypothetical protein JNM09_03495 [Blastocatellia bacterium]|nr:hypothetical protein [Blastocatellia bacterium]
MFRKTTVYVLTVALCLLVVGVPNVAAKSKAEKAAEFAAKVKTNIAKLGTGPDARIEVKLRDKTKLKGYISQVGTDSFVITDPETKAETNVPYPNVAKATGQNMSTGAKIAIGVLAGIGAVFLVLWIIYAATES